MRRSTRVLFYSLLFLLTVGALVRVSRDVRAAGASALNPMATITVRSSADAGGTCPGATCTLRQAIATAASGDTIDFDLTTVTSPITLVSELAIDKSLTIQGPGASLLTVSGNNAVRVFNIGGMNPAINVAISGLTIANGRHRGIDGAQGTNAFGGGILNDSTGTLSLINVVLTGNSAIGGDGSGNTARGGTGDGGGIFNRSTGIVSIIDSTISGNIAKGGNANDSGHIGDFGGGSSGGGISNGNGTINIANSTFSGNSATVGDTTQSGGGTGSTLFIIGAGGGAIINGNGTVNIFNGSLSGNSANGGTITNNGPNLFIAFGSLGGGIDNSGGTVNLTNSTLVGNSANGGTINQNVTPPQNGLNSVGGGILNGGQLTLTNSTITGNTAIGVIHINGGVSGIGEGGGVNNFVAGGTVTAKDTIIAGNTAEMGPDVRNTLTSQGWNLIGNNKDATITPAPGTADQIGTPGTPINPLLGPLANNGGPTMTMALLTGSPAIDKGAAAIDPITATPITTDQRGLPRPVDDPAIANAPGGNGSDIGAFEVQSVTPVAPPTVAKAFTSATITAGGASLLTITLSSAGISLTGASLTDTLPAGLATVGGTAATTCGGTASQTANSVSLSGGTIPAGGSCSLSVQVTSATVGTYTNTIAAGALTTTNGGANTTSASATLTVVAAPVGSPVGPGNAFPATSAVNDQKPGSVLIYNVYTSSSSPTQQNTRITLTNINPNLPIAVHLFFVDGASCSVADSVLCLTANQTTTFLASDLDPGTTGYIVAVAIDGNGCPANFNFLIGDEYVKFSSGHAANLAAEAIAALPGLPACNNTTVTATLNFDGISYNALPRVLAADSIASRADGNDTLLILNRIGGNLGVGASTLINLFGILYNDSEVGLSFGFGGASSSPGTCQFRSSLSNNFPRVTPRFEQFIPAGRSGWLKVFSQSDIALLGAVLNFNANAGTAAGAFNQGHNLHKLTLTTSASYIVPVFPPGC